MKQKLLDMMLKSESYIDPFACKVTKDIDYKHSDGLVYRKTIVVDEEPSIDKPHLSASLLSIDSLQESGNTALLKLGMFKTPTDLDRSEYLSDALMFDFSASEKSFIDSLK